MLHSSHSRFTAVICLFAIAASQPQGRAESAVVATGENSAQINAHVNRSDQAPVLIAQACPACGAEIGTLAAAGGIAISGSNKHEPVLTDSLLGNLVLEMAYQRDPQLLKLAKRMGYVNFGTLGAISTIAAGTLAQGIVALGTLNPPNGHEDSYVPGAIGVALSTATLATFGARMYLTHKLTTQVHDRQMTIKHHVEAVLKHLEHSNAQCQDAKKELVAMVGERACDEWVQLWSSSHRLAFQQTPRISSNFAGTIK